MKKKIIFGAVLLAFAWNLFLVVAATLNISSILPRVAGGQLDTMPTGLRILYGFQALLVIFQIYFSAQLYQRKGAWSKRSFLMSRIFLIIAAFGAVVNSVSPSPAERWNAIAAVVIAYGFYVLAGPNFRPTR